MTIKMDRSSVTLDKVERTKQDMREFKERYTDGDLFRMFWEALDFGDLWTVGDIVYAKLEAFPGGYSETDETHYAVDMLVEGWSEMYKLRFYISQSGEVDTRVITYPNRDPMPMYRVRKFTCED